MQSWWSPSGDVEDSSSTIQRLVEASRRAEIVALVNAADSEQEVARATVNELCEALEAEIAFVMVTQPGYGERAVVGRTGLSEEAATTLSADDLCRSALGTARAETHAGGDLLDAGVRQLVLSPWTAAKGRQVVIGVGRLYDEPFNAAEVALVETITGSVGHALERTWLSVERDQHAARQAALAHAAKRLSASLEGSEVLQTLATEIARALKPDVVAIYSSAENGVMEIVAGTGLPALAFGSPCPVGGGLCGEVERTGDPQLCQPFEVRVPAELPGLVPLRSGAAAPVRPYGEVAAIALIGYHGDRWVEIEDVELLSAFTELGAIAYRNAVDHAAARRAASLDSLTACLNHGAFQDRLHEELARAERNDSPLALVLMDINDFKAVNDTHGHLVGDALLRGAAEALRESVRPYDKVARYGGDEFALLLPNTDEDTARRILDRSLAAVARVRLAGDAQVNASAGLAYRRPGDDPNAMIARADEALMGLKRVRGRSSQRPRRDTDHVPRTTEEREHQHLRRLAMAVSLGTRLARTLEPRAIAETAIIELSGTLGYDRSVLARPTATDVLSVVAKGSGGIGDAHFDLAPGDSHGFDRAAGAALRRCIDERRIVLLSGPEPGGDRGPLIAGAQLAVPVYAGTELWGALGVHSEPPDQLDDNDAQLVQIVADHLGGALHIAQLHEQLNETHLGTAAALAAALEAKDHYTADHARSIADLAVAVGAALGLDGEALRDLRYGAIFHDIGKIAIPDAILNKPGPLDDDEYAEVRRHPEVGEQILAPVPLFAGVRAIVRHDHERWDGHGYPDGLKGEEIPFGARIVLAVDAYHAMRSDRPYRRALSVARARRELLLHADKQFDARVVRALIAVLERQPEIDAPQT